MGRTDPKVDAYIAKAPAYAKPILTRIRTVVHAAVPDIEEGTKWSAPHFDYKGIFCSMSAFKRHCMFGFWLHKALIASLSNADAATLAKTPPVLAAALRKHAKARATFEGASPSFKREYVEWITDAKSDETRQRRLETAIAWMAEGKARNWKYETRK